MKILLSGSTGFLGSYLLKEFIRNNHTVIALKRSTSKTWRINDYLENSSPQENMPFFLDIDKIKVKKIFTDYNIDIVVNTVTDYGKENKYSSIVETNLLFGLRLFEESLRHKVKTIINTDTLLSSNINSYALSKAQLVEWMKFLANQDTRMINIKIEHMYGPEDDEKKFIYWLINKLKENTETIPLTSGIQKRDFIYIDDVVSAYTSIINNLDKLAGYEEFELGCGSNIRVKQFIEQIYDELTKYQKIKTKLNFGKIPYRKNENMEMKADISKFKKLGWTPKTSICKGIEKLIKINSQ
jgi:CDP-paratose synthetase